MKTRIPLLLSCLLAVACGGNSEIQLRDAEIGPSRVIYPKESIASDPDYYYYDLISEIKIIPLETVENSLMYYIHNVVFSDNYIYVLHPSNLGARLSIFDSAGKYLKTLQRGQGPEDLLGPTSILFDQQSQIIFVNDQANQKISRYSPSGDYIGSNYYEMIVRDFFVADGKLIVFQNSASSLDKMTRIFVADSAFNIESTWNWGSDPYNYGFSSYFQATDRVFNVFKPLDNVLYTYVDGAIEKKYMYADERAKYNFSIYKDYRELIDNLEEGDYLAKGNFLETQDFLYSPFELGKHKMARIITSKSSGNQWKVKVKDGTFFCFLDFQGVFSYADNTFWGILPSDYLNNYWDGSNPRNLVSEADMEKLRSVKPDDNPIIVLFKLKSDL